MQGAVFPIGSFQLVLTWCVIFCLESSDRRVLTGYSIVNKQGLKDALTAWNADQPAAFATYGAMSTWDTSLIQDWTYLLETFGTWIGNEQGLAAWDTSGATAMNGCFYMTTFNIDIGGWDTSRVTDMDGE